MSEKIIAIDIKTEAAFMRGVAKIVYPPCDLDTSELREFLESKGIMAPHEVAAAAWAAFSTTYCAGWLSFIPELMDDFLQWVLRKAGPGTESEFRRIDGKSRWVTFNPETDEVLGIEPYRHQDGSYSEMCVQPMHCRCSQ